MLISALPAPLTIEKRKAEKSQKTTRRISGILTFYMKGCQPMVACYKQWGLSMALAFAVFCEHFYKKLFTSFFLVKEDRFFSLKRLDAHLAIPGNI